MGVILVGFANRKLVFGLGLSDWVSGLSMSGYCLPDRGGSFGRSRAWGQNVDFIFGGIVIVSTIQLASGRLRTGEFVKIVHIWGAESEWFESSELCRNGAPEMGKRAGFFCIVCGLPSRGHRSFGWSRAWGQNVDVVCGRIVVISTFEFTSNGLCFEKFA
jgi:hypothetical protein